MSQVIRATNMAHAFVNAAVSCIKSSKKVPWMAKRVVEHAERDDGVGILKEHNEINISGRSALEIDARVRRNLPGLI